MRSKSKKILCFVLILATAFSIFLSQMLVSAANKQTVREALDKVSETMETAEPVYQKLKEIIADEIAALDMEDDDTEPDLDEAEEGYEELNGYTAQLNGLISGLNGLPDNMSTSEGKTVCAAREYLTMLRNMTADLAELVRYSIDMYYAVEPMAMIEEDPDDFETLAEQIWTGCEEVKTLMEAIKPPAYLAITHNDMIARITEFRDFGEDFYVSCYLDDPLRMYSCIYRMNRIIRMFDICDENLTADMDLQFRQADRRLSGLIEQLRNEISKNLGILQDAQGRG